MAMRCHNCGRSSNPQDAGTNWNRIGSRDGAPLYECDCGHGLFLTGGCLGSLLGLNSTKHAGPDIVEHQKQQMRLAGIDPQKLPSAGDIQKRHAEAPPGDTHFELGERIINGRGWTGTVRGISTSAGSLQLQIEFDEHLGFSKGMTVGVDPNQDKVRRLTIESTERTPKRALTEILKEQGQRLSPKDWADIFSEGGTKLTFATLSKPTQLAFHSMALEQTEIFRKNFPDAVPADINEVKRDVGGYIFIGYIMGRYLVGTRDADVVLPQGDPQAVAVKLRETAGVIPDIAGLYEAGGPALDMFMNIHLQDQVQYRNYGRIRDRQMAVRYAFIPVLNGFALALAEYQMQRL